MAICDESRDDELHNRNDCDILHAEPNRAGCKRMPCTTPVLVVPSPSARFLASLPSGVNHHRSVQTSVATVTALASGSGRSSFPFIDRFSSKNTILALSWYSIGRLVLLGRESTPGLFISQIVLSMSHNRCARFKYLPFAIAATTYASSGQISGTFLAIDPSSNRYGRWQASRCSLQSARS